MNWLRERHVGQPAELLALEVVTIEFLANIQAY